MLYWILLVMAIFAFVFPLGLYYALKGEMDKKMDRYEKIIKGQSKEACMEEVRELLTSIQPQQLGLTTKKNVKPVTLSAEECVKTIHYHSIPQKEKNLSMLRKMMPLMLISFPLVAIPLVAFTAPLGFTILFSCVVIVFAIEFWFVLMRMFIPFLQEELIYLQRIDEHLSHMLRVSE